MSLPSFADIISNETTGTGCGANLTWEYDTETKTLTISGTGNMSDFDRLSTGMMAPWRKVKRIDDNLEKIVISEGVTSIGDYAFYYCDKLTSVIIPGSVKSIGKGAFYYCDALTGITIPEGVANIGEDAFQNCTGLTNVTIPRSVISIGDGAFDSCSALTDIAIPDGVKSIGTYAFQYCSGLINISLPDSITSIGDRAFYGTACYNNWYENSEQSSVLYIGHHLIKADEWVLGKNKVIGYTVESGTKTIADCAFYYCDSLTEVTIPESVVSIGSRAFDSCNGLTGITIPKSVAYIGKFAFYTCFDLESINVAGDNTAYCSEDGVLYNKDKTEIIRFPKEKTDTLFAIPHSVTSIADGAFEDCRKLTSIIIPYSVTSIGEHAFLNCKALTGITIPDGVLCISEKTFFGCESMTSVTIPNSVLIIEEGAFENCLKSIKVNYIGSEDDWNEVIGAGKNILSSANINYCKGIKAVRSADGKIVVKPFNMESGTVILALYNGDKLAEVQSGIYNGTEIMFTPTENYTRAKAMVWESLDGLIPVCGAKNIE